MYTVPKRNYKPRNTNWFSNMFCLDKSVLCVIVFTYFQVMGLFISGVNSDSINCSSVRQLFESRKMNITDVLKQPLSANSPRRCGSGASCCSEQTELLMTSAMRRQHEQNVRQQLSTLSSVLKTRATKFDEFFKELLTTAKGGFHDMFKRTYGIIYEQNSFVFTDLFEELEHYYAKGKVDLTDTMESFFNTLYQKMFTVINSHYRFDDKYLLCVSEHMKELKPFGDVPHKLSVEIKRSFVATRTFAQSLSIAGDIVNNMLNMPLTEDCSRALVRMSGCPLCQGLDVKTCYSYCSNVMKGCLAHHAELNNEWNSFVDAMDKVTERLIGPFNIQMVVGPIDTKISDAVMNFQENSYTVSQRVFNGCGGRPLLGERQRRSLSFHPRFRRAGASGEDGRGRHRERAGLDLERLVRDIRSKVKDTKQFWARLPYQACNNDPYVAGGKVNDSCWNGQATGSYPHVVMGDGLSNQQNNPEVAVDVSRPNSLLNEQIFALKTITSKLKNAYNGMDVEWIDIEEFSSGSGSGEGPVDEDSEDDSGSGMGFPTERTVNRPDNVPDPVRPDPGNDQDNQLHPMEDRIRYNVSSTGTSAHQTQRMSLSRALVSYLVPVVVMWFGGAVSEWLQ
ncbi:glypican-4 [Macrosteles quadrilineatus]|uniref:glypican-4 n=1 Tax=Macrosteles quadrilineatus TaxID=74068 RepID=UPI0023E1ACB6|nr:glypican-4 [Macrosteles quadrilineatus]